MASLARPGTRKGRTSPPKHGGSPIFLPTPPKHRPGQKRPARRRRASVHRSLTETGALRPGRGGQHHRHGRGGGSPRPYGAAAMLNTLIGFLDAPSFVSGDVPRARGAFHSWVGQGLSGDEIEPAWEIFV